jgi:predicted nucleotidyltransferase
MNVDLTGSVTVERRRLNAQEAAEALGVSVDAVRMRVRRGTLDSEHENGRLYVWLDTDSSNVYYQAQV